MFKNQTLAPLLVDNLSAACENTLESVPDCVRKYPEFHEPNVLKMQRGFAYQSAGCGYRDLYQLRFEIDLLDLVTVSEGKTDNESTFEVNQPVEVESLGIGDSLGRFKLVGKLGQGGFGSVFEAYDANLDRNVAIKIPKSENISATQARLFLREARLAAQLQNPNIVSVFEVGRDFDREIFFIVSELIRGDTLRAWARKQTRSEKEVATIMETICRAVHRAHLAGIIHRDLKPGNVLVDADDQPTLLTSVWQSGWEGKNLRCSRRSASGTLVYMSPEQADGGANRADARTDVYALGVLLYVLLSGKKPFLTTSNSILP